MQVIIHTPAGRRGRGYSDEHFRPSVRTSVCVCVCVCVCVAVLSDRNWLPSYVVDVLVNEDSVSSIVTPRLFTLCEI